MTNQIREVTITRTFDAPRNKVFRMWTDPELVKQWWGPTGFTNPVVELDPRPGGVMNIHMQAPDGTVYPGKGVFKEVVEPERLVFEDGAFEDENGEMQLYVRQTVTFEEVDRNRTQVTIHAVVLRATDAVQDALAGMEEGWNQSLDKFKMLNEMTEA